DVQGRTTPFFPPDVATVGRRSADRKALSALQACVTAAAAGVGRTTSFLSAGRGCRRGDSWVGSREPARANRDARRCLTRLEPRRYGKKPCRLATGRPHLLEKQPARVRPSRETS